MFQVTCIQNDGTERIVLLSPAAVLEADGDTRPDSRTRSVITKVDGRKLFVKESLEEIAMHLMPAPSLAVSPNSSNNKK